jgi:hypothetical protein
VAVRPGEEPDELDNALWRMGEKGYDLNKRKQAVQAVARLPVDAKRQPAVARTLASLLKEPVFRDDAAAALETWATAEQVPDLLVLAEQPGRPGASAIKALGRLKDPRALPVFARRLSAAFGRADAEAALRAWGKAAEKEVLPYLNSADEATRQSAAGLLAGFGTSDTAKLDQILADLAAAPRGQSYKAALDTLAGLRLPPDRKADVVRAVNLVLNRPKLGYTEGEAAAKMAAEQGDDCVDALAQALEGAEHRKNTYADALARINSPKAIAALLRLLQSTGYGVSGAAQEGLKKIGQPAEAPLLELLPTVVGADGQSRNLRIAIVGLLGEVGGRGAIPAMQLAAVRDQSIVNFVTPAIKKIQARDQP